MKIEDEPAVALTSTISIFTYRIEFQIERSPYLADFTETSSQTVTENPSPQPVEVSGKQSPKTRRPSRQKSVTNGHRDLVANNQQ
jgi:hypothetical protein